MRDANPLVKCLVWDLDNTLWQGTLLEDGQVHLPKAVRDVVVELDARGILQSVASRNDHEHAWEQMQKLGIGDYFVLPQIGWGPKSESLRAIAQELNFASAAMAFIDDQPAERAEVAHLLPQVRCYEAAAALTLPTLPEFSPATVTTDARRRREMYKAGFRRNAERSQFTGPDEAFLRTLGLAMRVERAGNEEISRIEELTLRTSQMNATGVHYSDQALRALAADDRHEVLVVMLSDRFGPHGAVGVILLEKGVTAWRLKLLATSCRVVSYGVGTVLLHWLADEAARSGAHLLADFHRTERNRMMEIAYRFVGFDDRSCTCREELPPTDGAQLLHLEPTRQSPPAHLNVIVPVLHKPGAASVAWAPPGG
ncbi:HAD-IIIC family phosphatase [Kitasatospora sp. NPDC059327]|uniref:HAD-IIIC family phosphatase n=1 Tax=Kitasatospora sp. NPDC059327 TaxID=3346803 RepID=UPI0036833A19